jgi:hypothetical protein
MHVAGHEGACLTQTEAKQEWQLGSKERMNAIAKLILPQKQYGNADGLSEHSMQDTNKSTR